jgi:hypothetical protein
VHGVTMVNDSVRVRDVLEHQNHSANPTDRKEKGLAARHLPAYVSEPRPRFILSVAGLPVLEKIFYKLFTLANNRPFTAWRKNNGSHKAVQSLKTVLAYARTFARACVFGLLASKAGVDAQDSGTPDPRLLPTRATGHSSIADCRKMVALYVRIVAIDPDFFVIDAARASHAVCAPVDEVVLEQELANAAAQGIIVFEEGDSDDESEVDVEALLPDENKDDHKEEIDSYAMVADDLWQLMVAQTIDTVDDNTLHLLVQYAFDSLVGIVCVCLCM